MALPEKTGGTNYGAGLFESDGRHTEGSLQQEHSGSIRHMTKMGGYQRDLRSRDSLVRLGRRGRLV